MSETDSHSDGTVDEHDSDVVDAALDEIEDTDTDYLASSVDDASNASAQQKRYSDTELHSIDDGDKQHVTMECTMDISDLDAEDKEVICQLARQFEDSFAEVVEKNRDYSWSFLKTGKGLADMESTPIDSVVRSDVYGLLTRADDKRERLIENVYGNGSASVSDEPSVTAKEAANYYHFMAFVLANPDLAASVGES